MPAISTPRSVVPNSGLQGYCKGTARVLQGYCNPTPDGVGVKGLG